MLDDILVDGMELAVTLLSPEEQQHAHDNYTFQMTFTEVPILHVMLPLPSGEWSTSYVPDAFTIPPSVQALVTGN